jgi:hypothetical protein
VLFEPGDGAGDGLCARAGEKGPKVRLYLDVSATKGRSSWWKVSPNPRIKAEKMPPTRTIVFEMTSVLDRTWLHGLLEAYARRRASCSDSPPHCPRLAVRNRRNRITARVNV